MSKVRAGHRDFPGLRSAAGELAGRVKQTISADNPAAVTPGRPASWAASVASGETPRTSRRVSGTESPGRHWRSTATQASLIAARRRDSRGRSAAGSASPSRLVT
jgi:hypothetical protein